MENSVAAKRASRTITADKNYTNNVAGEDATSRSYLSKAIPGAQASLKAKGITGEGGQAISLSNLATNEADAITAAGVSGSCLERAMPSGNGRANVG